MKYQVIYADPPWWYNTRKAGTVFGSGAHKYDLMQTKDICALNVAAMADKNCALFMWTTGPRIPDAVRVIDSWGFRYATIAFVWVKISRYSTPLVGPGYYTGSNSEIVLLGVKGKMPPRQKLVQQIVFAPRQSHSAKPIQVAQRIELMYEGPRVELFARRNMPGWNCIGKDLGSTVEDACIG